jgi:carbon storage regulator
MSYLVLSRKDSQVLLIGNDIKIKIFKSISGKTRIGIEAPKSVPVLRAELLEQLNHPVPSVQGANTSTANVA